MRQAVFVGLTLLYPLAIWLGGGRLEPRTMALGLVALAVARLVSTKQRVWLVVGLGALLLALLAGFLNVGWPLKLYPVVVNGSLLALFSATLIRPPSMIERIARLREKNLSPTAIQYTRKVTMVWCGFFVVNGSIAAVTAGWASEAGWALYNGLIAYLAMGVLFGGELVIRHFVKRREIAS